MTRGNAGIGRSCMVCGARTAGTARCADHAQGVGLRARPCMTCGAPTQGSDWCTEHQGTARGWREVYSDKRWAAARRECLHRAGGRCASCGALGLQLQADHVRPLLDGGAPFDQLNLQALCTECHHAKTSDDKARRSSQLELVCTECGNDTAAVGYPYCTECLHHL